MPPCNDQPHAPWHDLKV